MGKGLLLYFYSIKRVERRRLLAGDVPQPGPFSFPQFSQQLYIDLFSTTAKVKTSLIWYANKHQKQDLCKKPCNIFVFFLRFFFSSQHKRNLNLHTSLCWLRLKNRLPTQIENYRMYKQLNKTQREDHKLKTARNGIKWYQSFSFIAHKLKALEGHVGKQLAKFISKHSRK